MPALSGVGSDDGVVRIMLGNTAARAECGPEVEVRNFGVGWSEGAAVQVNVSYIADTGDAEVPALDPTVLHSKLPIKPCASVQQPTGHEVVEATLAHATHAEGTTAVANADAVRCAIFTLPCVGTGAVLSVELGPPQRQIDGSTTTPTEL